MSLGAGLCLFLWATDGRAAELSRGPGGAGDEEASGGVGGVEAGEPAGEPGAGAGAGPTSVESTRGEEARKPTFWTIEASGGLSARPGVESYEPGPHGTLRLAWGGLWAAVGWYVYAVGGLQLGYTWGQRSAAIAEIRFNRLQVAPFIEARAAVPVAHEGRTRLYIGVGFGLAHEELRASFDDENALDTESWRPEIRLLAGIWQRVSERVSVFANYRLRASFGLGGEDPISELLEPRSSAPVVPVHAAEVGAAYHF